MCYAPRKAGTPEKLLGLKRQAFTAGRQTSHWPAPKRVRRNGGFHRNGGVAWKGIKMFPVKPQFSQHQASEPLEGVDKINTEEGLRELGEHVPALAGF